MEVGRGDGGRERQRWREGERQRRRNKDREGLTQGTHKTALEVRERTRMRVTKEVILKRCSNHSILSSFRSKDLNRIAEIKRRKKQISTAVVPASEGGTA